MSGFDPDELRNPPLLIFFLRDNPSWRGLCERLKLEDPYGPYNTSAENLFGEVKALRDLGILEFEGDKRADMERHDSIRVMETWPKLQAGLHLSLRDLVKISEFGRGLAVTPFFGKPPPKRQDQPDIFVIMPFTPDYDVIYRDHVRKVAKKLGRSIMRGDERLDSGEIMKQIWGDMFYAKVILAECTELNANVFYELGIIHTLGKPFVMIRRAGTNPPFDIAGLKWFAYEYTPPGMTDFERRLAEVLRPLFQSHQ
jgi:hypothetical protein